LKHLLFALMSLRAGADYSGVVQGFIYCVKGSPRPSTPRLIGFFCPGNSPIDNRVFCSWPPPHQVSVYLPWFAPRRASPQFRPYRGPFTKPLAWSGWPARWLGTLSLRFEAMPEYYQKPASLCNLFHENKTIEQMIAIVKINRP